MKVKSVRLYQAVTVGRKQEMSLAASEELQLDWRDPFLFFIDMKTKAIRATGLANVKEIEFVKDDPKQDASQKNSKGA